MDNTFELSNRQIRVLGLACVCPLGEQLSNCCMGELREKPLRERASLIKNMPEEELDRIIAQHKACFAKREHE